MFRPRLIPVLLLKNNGLVKTTKFKKPRYLGDPLNAVQIFNKFHTDELIFLDIDASLHGKTISPSLVAEIGDEAFMPFAVGGGITKFSQARKLISAGAEKVVINTGFSQNHDLISEISNTFGKQSVVVSIDVKKNFFGNQKVYIKSGSINTGFDPVKMALLAEEYGAGEIMITSIDHDGLKMGFDYNLINEIQKSVRIPVIANGGLYSLNHYKLAFENGASAIAGGSFFVYSGNQDGILINYPEKNDLFNLFNQK
jgi:cyclase